MTYEVTWSKRARRALELDLPEAAAAACLEFVLGPLAANPHRVGKLLRGELHDRYSARRGEFRVVYRVYEDLIIVNVVDIRHRRDIY